MGHFELKIETQHIILIIKVCNVVMFNFEYRIDPDTFNYISKRNIIFSSINGRRVFIELKTPNIMIIEDGEI